MHVFQVLCNAGWARAKRGILSFALDLPVVQPYGSVIRNFCTRRYCILASPLESIHTNPSLQLIRRKLQLPSKYGNNTCTRDYSCVYFNLIQLQLVFCHQVWGISAMCTVLATGGFHDPIFPPLIHSPCACLSPSCLPTQAIALYFSRYSSSLLRSS